MPQSKHLLLAYVVWDVFASAVVWISITLIRQKWLHENNVSLLSSYFLLTLIFVVAFWEILFFIAGTYQESLYRKSRINEFLSVTLQTLLGSLILFFILFLDDLYANTNYFYKVLTFYWCSQTIFIYFGRFIFLTIAKRQIKNKQFFINTLFVGNNKNALEIYKELNYNASLNGFRGVGFVTESSLHVNGLSEYLPHLGNFNNIEAIIETYNIQEVIIALDKTELFSQSAQFLSNLNKKNVEIKILPDTVDILSGSVKASHVLEVPLVSINALPMPYWQKNLKRIIDIFFSALGLILLSPLFIFLIIRTYFSSKGSVFYVQERIGLKGNPFKIYKFRSMYEDAEKNGPMLSFENDERITAWGKTMRKWRLDELPQLWNVLRGDMSLVGPRPERAFYIQQIVQHNPYFFYLLKVKPGLTSWGMVRYGYASSVPEMLERIKYDFIYLENASLLMDFKILLHSITTIFTGKGK